MFFTYLGATKIKPRFVRKDSTQIAWPRSSSISQATERQRILEQSGGFHTCWCSSWLGAICREPAPSEMLIFNSFNAPCQNKLHPKPCTWKLASWYFERKDDLKFATSTSPRPGVENSYSCKNKTFWSQQLIFYPSVTETAACSTW